MAKFAPPIDDPHGDPLTSPQHADPYGLGAFLKKTIEEIHVDRRVVGWSVGHHHVWITHVGGKFRHGLLEKSLIKSAKKFALTLFKASGSRLPPCDFVAIGSWAKSAARVL